MMTLQEAIEKIKQHREMICSELPEGPLFTALQAVADGTLIPADEVFQVRDGCWVYAYKGVHGEVPVPLTEALEIRSADDVRREGYAEGYKDGFKKSGWSEMQRQTALIDTPQPKGGDDELASD